jgi:putative two-component system response regulator
MAVDNSQVPSVASTGGSGARILVADDSDEMVSLLTEFLEDAGYRVITAADGKEALRMVETEAPDLILLDAMMPRLTGFEAVRHLKTNPSTRLTPVIMLTGLTDLNDKLRGIELGVDDFITKPFNRLELLTRVRSLLRVKVYTDELENAETVIFSLALAVESKDSYTESHCYRLSYYGEKLAQKMGLSEEVCKAVRRGGILHDIGKIAIADSILHKRGKLTPDEFEVMKQHTVLGERICKPLKSLANVLPIIRSHQERWNGSGYPDGLKGEDIPITARVIMTVDLYDALTTDRPYRDALTEAQAFDIMRDETAMGLWDATLMNAFIGMLEKAEIERFSEKNIPHTLIWDDSLAQTKYSSQRLPPRA